MRFELTAETKTWLGRKVFRLKALIDFGDVKAGDLGGWAQDVENIQPGGEAWVYGEALVCDKARVCDKALVYGEARVCDKALVYGEARVYDKARVCGEALVCGFTAEKTEEIKQDLFKILAANRTEVPALLEKLRSGQIDGSCYEGRCACLVGTIANIRECDYRTIGPDSNRPAERWFMAISPGNKPEDGGAAYQTEQWILEFLSQDKEAA